MGVKFPKQQPPNACTASSVFASWAAFTITSTGLHENPFLHNPEVSIGQPHCKNLSLSSIIPFFKKSHKIDIMLVSSCSFSQP